MWHLTAFFLPSVALGGIAALLAKLLWRREFAATAWWRLAVRLAFSAAAVAVAGLVALGHDGRMLTYLGMVLAAAGSLWWCTRPRR